jgi:DNA-binding PadR family transcriptional regulator
VANRKWKPRSAICKITGDKIAGATCAFAIITQIRNRMSKSKPEYDSSVADRDLYSGLIRLHVLHHAVEGPIFGLGMIEELARHGYRISPGSLYPLLKSLEKKGYLQSTEERNGKSRRLVYRATRLGRKALAASKSKVRELFHELVEGD